MRADHGGPGWAWTIALVADIALCIVLAARVRVGSPPSIEIAGDAEPCSSELLDGMRTRYRQLQLVDQEERFGEIRQIARTFERCGERLPPLTSAVDCLPANGAVARYWVGRLGSDSREQLAHGSGCTAMRR